MHIRPRSLLLIPLLAALPGCMEKQPTGGGGTQEQEHLPLAGRWTFQASDVTGPGVTCTASGYVLELTQDEETLGGELRAGSGTFTCQSTTDDPAVPPAFPTQAAVVGELDIDRLLLQHVSRDAAQQETFSIVLTGSASKTLLTGPLTMRERVATGGFRTLTGTYRATKIVE